MATVNFDFSSVFDKDVIINDNGTTTDPLQDPVGASGGVSYGLITQSFATFKAGANGNGLPDNGFFAANSYHPDLQLGYSNTNDGNNAKILTSNGSSFTFNVTANPYSKIHLFATGTNGSGTIDVKFNYSDGTNSTSSATIPDIATSITESASSYYLINGLDLTYDTTGSNYWDFNGANIFGLGLTPNTAKTLQSITVTRTSGTGVDTWLDFFGATGESLPNSPPSITSANSANIPENTTAVLTVTATDPNGDIPTYSLTGGVDKALFQINSSTGILGFNSAPDFELPADSNKDNIYQLEVTADDGKGGTVVQPIAVTVTDVAESVPNSPPSITSANSAKVAENTTAVLTVTATDPNGDTPTYSLTGGVDKALFQINSSTGILAFNSATDFELPADSNKDNIYQLEVTANDGKGGTVVQPIAVTVTDVVEGNPSISVTQALDNGKGDTQGTLSWAIDLANKTPGADTIKLNTDVRLNFGSDVIRMWSLINSDMTIDGQGYTINGDNNNNGKADKDDRPIFFVYGGKPEHTDKGVNGFLDVTFKNLTLKNAVAKGGDGLNSGGGAGMGGALFIYQGNITVDGVKFEGNQAIGGNATGGYDQFSGGIGLQNIAANNGGFGSGGQSSQGGQDSPGGPGGFGGGGGRGGDGGDGGDGGYGGNGGYGGPGGFGGGGGRGGYGGDGANGANGRQGGEGGEGGQGGQGGFGGGEGGQGGKIGKSTRVSKGNDVSYGGKGGSGGPGGGGAGMGGAIFIRDGNLTVTGSSSFQNNSAAGGQGRESRISTDDGQGLGGAIFALSQAAIEQQKKINGQGLPTAPPTVTISTDTTFAGNLAANADTKTKTQDFQGTNLNTDAVFSGDIKVATPAAISKIIKARALDGPISGATAFLDTNFNRTQDSDEPGATTDAAGNFTLEIAGNFDLNSNGTLDFDEGEYVVVGGTDAITGQAFTGTLRALPDSTVVTPLTTLISALVDTGALPEASETQVKTALGLPSTINLATFDPITSAQAGSSEGLGVLGAQVAVQTLISQISNSLETVIGISSNSLDAQVTGNLAQLLQSGSFNLSDSPAIQTLITNIVSDITSSLAEVDPADNTINLEAITTNVAQLSQVIAASNQQILTATTTDGIFQAQKVAQTSVSQDLVAAFNGTKSFSEVVANNTGVALTNQIKAATIDTSAIIQAYADSYLSGDQVLRSINGSYITPILASNPPHDLMFGDDLANTLMGGIGNDTIFGRSGDDLLFGNQNQDFIHGNQGNDTIFAGKDDDLVRGGQGDDLICGDLGNDSLCGDLGNDTVYGGIGDDVVLGNAGDDVLNGNQGHDILFGGDGNDLLHGGQDHDFLSGGVGNDSVYGDLGNDTLCGYTGNDSLFGGAGSDIFVLGSGQGSDVIADFVVGQDWVKLINNLSLADLTISQGTGNQVADTLIRVTATNELLASLSNVSANLITANSFLVG